MVASWLTPRRTSGAPNSARVSRPATRSLAARGPVARAAGCTHSPWLEPHEAHEEWHMVLKYCAAIEPSRTQEGRGGRREHPRDDRPVQPRVLHLQLPHHHRRLHSSRSSGTTAQPTASDHAVLVLGRPALDHLRQHLVRHPRHGRPPARHVRRSERRTVRGAEVRVRADRTLRSHVQGESPRCYCCRCVLTSRVFCRARSIAATTARATGATPRASTWAWPSVRRAALPCRCSSTRGPQHSARTHTLSAARRALFSLMACALFSLFLFLSLSLSLSLSLFLSLPLSCLRFSFLLICLSLFLFSLGLYH